MTDRAVPTNYPERLCIEHLLAAKAKNAADDIAISAPDGTCLTYDDLCVQAKYVVEQLNVMGVGRNDRVAIVLPNGPLMAVAFLAVASGATCVPLNPAYRQEECDFYLSDLNAKALLVETGADSPARSAAHARGIPVIDLAPSSRDESIIFRLEGNGFGTASLSGCAAPDDVALVLHTSGTTSRPKIVPLTHTNICASAHHIQVSLQLQREDRCLNVMPLFHIHGLIGAVLSSLAAGGSIVCTPGFHAHEFLHWLGECEPTWYTAVPTMHQAILGQAATGRETIDRCPLRFIRSSSAPLPPHVMNDLETVFGVPVIESYGMTEASHQMASNPLPPLRRKAGSVGRAAGPEVAIVDDGGNPLEVGDVGEIVIRGVNVTEGYERNPTANTDAFIHDWFRTGDQGFLDSDGYLFITGRLKEIINRGGEKISPREVDEVIMDHAAIAQAVAFAVPHAKLGEDVVVAVVLREDATATEKDIREFAFARLADFKVPSRVVIVDEIPKGSTGKLQRIGLADKLSARLQVDFVETRNSVEDTIAGIWSTVLNVDKVGIRDNFFSLGGDSILAGQVSSRLRKSFHVELPTNVIFKEPNVAELALLIQETLLREVEELTEDETTRLLARNIEKETDKK